MLLTKNEEVHEWLPYSVVTLKIESMVDDEDRVSSTFYCRHLTFSTFTCIFFLALKN